LGLAGFLGVHHGLHAVAEAELEQDAGDVRLHGPFAHDKFACDLGVGEPARDEAEDFPLALGQLVERRKPLAPARSVGIRMSIRLPASKSSP
jgi:hypothetical protein